MAVTSTKVYGVSGSRDREGNRRYTVTYKVETNSVNDDPIKVMAGAGVPPYADPYTFGTSQDLLATRDSIECDYWDREATAKMFRLVAMYSSTPVVGRPDVSGAENDPTLLPPKIYGSFIKEVVPITHQDGHEDPAERERPVVNVFGEFFRDGTKAEAHQDMTIELYKASFNPTLIEDYVECINSAEFFTGAARTWKLDNVGWEQVWFGAVKYYQVRYQFLRNRKGWDFTPKVEGTVHEDTIGNIVAFRSDDGFVHGDGWGNLNEDGSKRTFPFGPLFYGIAPCTLPAWKVYPAIDFGSVLGVPVSL